MGDSESRWPELARGLTGEGSHSFRTAYNALVGQGEEWWARAELHLAELLAAIQPNPASELRRRAIFDYITKLIQSSCGYFQVLQFGSVPLRTYLPDGDIDLTVVCPNPEFKRTWIDDVHNVLLKEIDNPKSEFRITQVELISAEVKLIKIYVENFLVDLSFDQRGGLSTLCFLEEVDRLIGEDHLFKRSVILVKAWCYYESRLLGANCNLMSTYALETLVLYIFHRFHGSLRGPLQVIYLFLEFFNGFDWETYGVSLWNPVLLSSFLPEIKKQDGIAEDFQNLVLSPGREGGELLFTRVFIDKCKESYGLMSKPGKFNVKFLNIVDTLRSTNNLGRSVNQGNCARIRRAFELGSRTLRAILHVDEADVCSEIDKFFKNCNFRFQGSSPRPDVASHRLWQDMTIPNGVPKMGGSKRTDRNDDVVARTSVSQVGDHPQQDRVYRIHLPDPNGVGNFGYGVEHDSPGIVSPSAVEVPSVRDENTNESTVNFRFGSGVELPALNFMSSSNGPNGDFMARDPRHVDEDAVRVKEPVLKRIPSQSDSLQSARVWLPVRSGGYQEADEMFEERKSSDHESSGEQEILSGSSGSVGVANHVTAVGGSQHISNGAPSSFRVDDDLEGRGESSSQSSSSKGEVSASENVPVLGNRDTKRGSLPLSCRPANLESSRHGSSSELQGRPPDPERPPLDVAGAETEVYNPSTYREQSSSVRREEERDVPVHVIEFMHSGNEEFAAATETSPSKVPMRKGKIHQQNGNSQSNEFGSGLMYVKRRRGPGKEKGFGRAPGPGAQDAGQVSSSSDTALSPKQASGPTSVYERPHRRSSTDLAAAGTQFKGSQNRPNPNNASGPGSYRHPLAHQQQYYPGATAGNQSASSFSSDPQFVPPYYPPQMQLPPGFSRPSMYSPGLNNMLQRNSSGQGDGNDRATANSRLEQDAVEPARTENSVDSPRENGEPKTMRQFVVGIVERLEAEGKAASTSSRRPQTSRASRSNNHGAGVPGGTSNADFLSGDLRFHLEILAYARWCEAGCNPSLQYQVGYPAWYGSEHMHGPWEGPSRPAQMMGHPAFYGSGRGGYFPLFHPQAGQYPQLQPLWGPRGVELSPRPRGTGTYLPNSRTKSRAVAM